MKPKIHLVHGHNTSRGGKSAHGQVQGANNDTYSSAGQRGGAAGILLESLLEVIIRAAGASAGIVRVLSPEGHQLRQIASSGLRAESRQDVNTVDARCGVCGKSLGRQDVEFTDAEFCMNQYGAAFFAEECKFVLAVPLGAAGRKGDVSGVVTLFFAAAKNVTDDVKRTLVSYAELMHIALKNAWQNEDRYQVNLLAERQSIANEIHDSLAQTLYFAKIRTSLLLDALKTKNEILSFKCAQDIDEALEGSQKTVRELVTHFRCQMDPDGLQCALQKLAKDFIARSGIALEYNNQVEKFDLPPEYELQVFLIAREALVNVASHSGADKARLNVDYADGIYKLVVEDNGGGIGGGAPAEGHYGMVIMRERALRIGGAVEVSGLEGKGTHVQLIFSAPAA